MPVPAKPASLPLAVLIGHAADAVAAVRGGTSLNEALGRCPPEARPGAQSLSFHVLRWLGAAEVVRRRLAPKQPPPAVDALLLSALALLWPAGTPPYADHVLVDQVVAAAKRRAPASAAFVNAVLRRFLRERDALVAAALEDPLARWNHPAWWMDRLRRDWPADWEGIAAADNAHPPMTLRVNARRGTAAGYVARLADAGIVATAGPGHVVSLDRPVAVTRLPGFAAGDVSVQDAAAQRAAELLVGPLTSAPLSSAPLAPGARVLDACAAPGGKTAHLLELAELDVLAIDRDPARLVRVDETLARLGLHATTLAADAAEPAAWWDGRPFDAVLLDAPCSASGIVRRHPDVRWLRRAADIPALVAIQARLLDALWPLLAPGGRLLYCTCSVFRAEGQAQIDAFLQRESGACVAASPPSPGHLLPLPDNPRTPSAPASGPGRRWLFPDAPREETRLHIPMIRPPSPGSLRRRSLLHALGVAALRSLPGTGLGGALAAAAPAASAVEPKPDSKPEPKPEPKLTSFDVSRDEDGVHLSYAVDFDLGHGVDDALMKSVPLFFVAQAEIFRDRWYWRDRRVSEAIRTWRIVYQPLTGTYRVTTLGGLSQSYATRSEAPGAISRATNWRIAEPGQMEDGRHYLEFQFRLDTTELPRPMQIGISGEPDWQLSIKRTLRIN